MKVAVLASGSGTILEAMLDAKLPVGLIVVDRDCRAISVGEQRGVPAVHVERNSFGADFDRTAYTRRVVAVLVEADVELVVMAGFGTILDQPMYDRFAGKVLNTHPSLLPAFPGWHAVEAALDHGVKVTGCTVHVATLEVDAGPILAQCAVDVEPTDTAQTLHERIKVVERSLYLATVQDILDRGWVLEGAQP